MKHVSETMPERLSIEISKLIPEMDAKIEKLMNVAKSFFHISWPEWCFIPMAFKIELIRGLVPIGSVEWCKMLDKTSAIILWKRNKAIYRFDPDLLKQLKPGITETFKPPVELLYHMPYPCVYIEGLPGAADLDGAFFYLDYDHRFKDMVELRIVYLFKDGDVFSIYRQWDINNQQPDNPKMRNGRYFLIDDEYTNLGYTDVSFRQKAGETMMHALWHMNLFLYLCSEEPDISRDAPTPKMRGKGIVKCANRPDVAYVGRYIGANIRKYVGTTDDVLDDRTTGATVRPHMRRAHWHLYWSGHGKMVPKIRWVSPIFVKGDGNEIPTSIHYAE